jgi:hypothetical protein
MSIDQWWIGEMINVRGKMKKREEKPAPLTFPSIRNLTRGHPAMNQKPHYMNPESKIFNCGTA